VASRDSGSISRRARARARRRVDRADPHVGVVVRRPPPPGAAARMLDRAWERRGMVTATAADRWL